MLRTTIPPVGWLVGALLVACSGSEATTDTDTDADIPTLPIPETGLTLEQRVRVLEVELIAERASREQAISSLQGRTDDLEEDMEVQSERIDALEDVVTDLLQRVDELESVAPR